MAVSVAGAGRGTASSRPATTATALTSSIRGSPRVPSTIRCAANQPMPVTITAIATTRAWRWAAERAGQAAGCSHMSATPASRFGHDRGPLVRTSTARSVPQRSRNARG